MKTCLERKKKKEKKKKNKKLRVRPKNKKKKFPLNKGFVCWLKLDGKHSICEVIMTP